MNNMQMSSNAVVIKCCLHCLLQGISGSPGQPGPVGPVGPPVSLLTQSFSDFKIDATKEVKWEEPACRHFAEAKSNDYRPVCTTRGWVYQDGGKPETLQLILIRFGVEST